MKKKIKDKEQIDLFEERKQDEKLFNLIKVEEIQFPLFFKSKSETIYTCYFNESKFEQITIKYKSEPFLCSIMFGFNEQMISFKDDLKILLYILYKNQIEIDREEYEEVFNRAKADRKRFFETNEIIYRERELTESQKNVKHKWKPIEL